MITVQTDGAMNFDAPVPVRFPNLPDPVTGLRLPPGARSSLWSFDHDLGRWTVVGTLIVTPGADFLVSDEGSGIRQPGWHGSSPAGDNPPCRPNPPKETIGIWDLTTAAWDCAKGLIPMKEGLRCAMEMLVALGEQAEFMHGVIVLLRDAKKNDACALVESSLSQLEKSKSVIERLGVCITTVNPIRRGEVVINCLKLAVDLAAKVCGSVEMGPPGSPCEAGAVLTWTCNGIGFLHTMLAEAQGILAEVRRLIELILLKKAGAPALDALIDALRLVLAEICDSRAARAVAGDELTPAQRAELIRIFGEIETVLAPAAEASRALSRLIELASALDEGSGQLGSDAKGLERDSTTGTSHLVIEYGTTLLRTTARVGSTASVFLPPGVEYRVSEYWPASRLFGSTTGVSAAVGQSLPLAQPELVRDTSLPDGDGDGLSDRAEFVLGTDPVKSDTDGDGVSDGAEIGNGTDPLDGFPVATGIIASAATAGTALDVCALNQVVLVADSAAGVAVFTVGEGSDLVRAAQVDTPGTALAVAWSGGLVAVADGTQGLAVLDVADPAGATRVRQIPLPSLGEGSAQAVATVADLGFVGTTGGDLCMIDLAAGLVLQRLDMGGVVEDLAVEGTTLYAFAGGRIHILPFAKGPMILTGSVASPAPSGINRAHGRGRLFVGNGVAYAVHTKGYNTIDVRDPVAPRLLKAGNTSQFGWKQIVLNGSGIGLAAVSPNQGFDGPHHVSMYDTRDTALTDAFLSQFETPGVARSVTLHNGLAYVADHQHGLHVVNYLPYDNLGAAPKGSLEAIPSGEAMVEGGLVLLRANVSDDVQVRSVVFQVNGVPLVEDGSFPFETVYRVPPGSLGALFEFSIRIVDTGRHETVVAALPLTVQPDGQPPGISVDEPVAHQRSFHGDSLRIRASVLDNAGVASLRFLLNGVPVTAERVSLTEWRLERVGLGTHTLTLSAVDVSGNVATTDPVPFVVRSRAISREWSLMNFGAPELQRRAISRSVSLYTTEADDSRRRAISREISVDVRP